jgi:NitT/TauT family transport system permease protein
VWETIADESSLLISMSLGTLYATVVGFLAAAAVGLLTAILIVYSPTMERSIYPIILLSVLRKPGI